MEWATTAIPNQPTSNTNRATSYVSNGSNVLVIDNVTGRVLGDYALPTTGGTGNESIFYNEQGQQVTCTFDENDQQCCYTVYGNDITKTENVSLAFLDRSNVSIEGLILRNAIGAGLSAVHGPLAYAFTDPTVQKYALMCILNPNNASASGWGASDWVDLGVGFIPYIGNGNDTKVAISGFNDITGEQAGCLERVVRGVFGIPGLIIDIAGTTTAGKLLMKNMKKTGNASLMKEI